MPSPSERLIPFYLGKATDSEGRTLTEIQSFDHQKLEAVHDYIQWLFPLQERSNFNARAPLLSSDHIQAFQTDDRLRQALLKSFALMLTFYGCELNDSAEEIQVSKSANWTARAQNWLTLGNHNLLRISRILRSLTILGCARHAEAFFRLLTELNSSTEGRPIGRSYEFWEDAVRIQKSP